MKKAQASVKNNTIHRVLGVLQSGEKYSYTPEEVVNRMNTRFKKFSIHQVGYACRIINQDGYFLMQDSRGLIIITSPSVLSYLRESYKIEEYKEIQKWWLWPARVLSALVGIATIIGVADSCESRRLSREIIQKNKHIESLTTRTLKDSIVISSIRDSIKTLKKHEIDSSKVNI